MKSNPSYQVNCTVCSNPSLGRVYSSLIFKDDKESRAKISKVALNLDMCANHQCAVCHSERRVYAFKDLILEGEHAVKLEECRKHWCYEHQIKKTVPLPDGTMFCPLEVCRLYSLKENAENDPLCDIKSSGSVFCEQICKCCWSKHLSYPSSRYCDDCCCSVENCRKPNVKPATTMCMVHYKTTLAWHNKYVCRVCGSGVPEEDNGILGYGCRQCRCMLPKCDQYISPGDIACPEHRCQCLSNKELGSEKLLVTKKLGYDKDLVVHRVPSVFGGVNLTQVEFKAGDECPHQYKREDLHLCASKKCRKPLLFPVAQISDYYTGSGYYWYLEDYIKKNYPQEIFDSIFKSINCDMCSGEYAKCKAEKGCEYFALDGESRCLFHKDPPRLCYRSKCNNLAEEYREGFNPIRLCLPCANSDKSLFLVNNRFMVYPKAVSMAMMNNGYNRVKIHEFVVGVMSWRKKSKAGLLKPIDRKGVPETKANLIWFTSMFLYQNYETARNVANVQLAALEKDPSLSFSPSVKDDGTIAILFMSILPLDLALRIFKFVS